MKGKQFMGVLLMALIVGSALGGAAFGVRHLVKSSNAQKPVQSTVTPTKTTATITSIKPFTTPPTTVITTGTVPFITQPTTVTSPSTKPFNSPPTKAITSNPSHGVATTTTAPN